MVKKKDKSKLDERSNWGHTIKFGIGGGLIGGGVGLGAGAALGADLDRREDELDVLSQGRTPIGTRVIAPGSKSKKPDATVTGYRGSQTVIKHDRGAELRPFGRTLLGIKENQQVVDTPMSEPSINMVDAVKAAIAGEPAAFQTAINTALQAKAVDAIGQYKQVVAQQIFNDQPPAEDYAEGPEDEDQEEVTDEDDGEYEAPEDEDDNTPEEE